MFELYGITRETFTANVDAWLNALHPEDKEATVAASQAALNGEIKFDTVFRICHPDGTVKHIKADGLVIRGTDGTEVFEPYFTTKGPALWYRHRIIHVEDDH